jgi:hypothetical protein
MDFRWQNSKRILEGNNDEEGPLEIRESYGKVKSDMTTPNCAVLQSITAPTITVTGIRKQSISCPW